MIQVEAVTKRYGKLTAVDEVSLTIPAGEIDALVGANGAGKSTLLKILLGLIPFDGEARVLGLDPRHEAFGIRDRVG